ncbi:unnamed protein product [Enterobius vermicularis]|uniref:BAH domain-containing protein n=1 Tax=Enterobius vermicularis TaxID=51028 RepID=A0A0N4V5R2_ENTVE|nr:unnamed protein product [Enterobius vermicularis]
MRKTFCIDDILARVYPEEKVESPTIFTDKRFIEECRINEQTEFCENRNSNAVEKVKKENVEDIAKLEKQTVPLGNKTPLMTVSSEQTNNIQTGTDDDEKKCIDSVQVITNAVRPSPSLTPSLDPELLKRLEAEDTPRRILRASTIAVTKRSLERKQSAHKKQKRKAENKDVKEPRRKIKKKSKETFIGSHYDTPIEVKINDDQSLGTPSSSGVSSMSGTSSPASVKSRGRKKIQQKIHSNWVPVTSGEKHYTYTSNDIAPIKLLCFPEVKHKKEPERIRINDAVIVNSEDGSRNIGKVTRIFLDKEGSLMATLFWYYTNEQVEVDKNSINPPISPRELLASRHIDAIPVDTIQEVVYVLTVNEYNRYVAENKIDALPREERPRVEDEVWPRAEKEYHRRSSLPCEDSLPELVYFCRRIYDFKQKRITTNCPVTTRKSVAGRKVIAGRRAYRH